MYCGVANDSVNETGKALIKLSRYEYKEEEEEEEFYSNAVEHQNYSLNSGLEVIKLFSCSTQLSMKFVLFINLKILTKF